VSGDTGIADLTILFGITIPRHDDIFTCHLYFSLMYIIVPFASDTYNLLIYAEGAAIVTSGHPGVRATTMGGGLTTPIPHAVLILPVVHDTIVAPKHWYHPTLVVSAVHSVSTLISST